MDSRPSFASLWNGSEMLELSDDASAPKICVYAHKFSAWAEELLARNAQESNIALVYQSMLMLLIKYMEWRTVVPKSHRNRIGDVGQHRCIWHVFEQAYYHLKTIELALTPPLLFLSQPVSPVPQPPQEVSGGIFIGLRNTELDKPKG